MVKKLSYFFEFFIFAILIAFCIILSFCGNFSLATLNGISLWFSCVLPSLFPYLFITTILNSLQITKKISLKFSPISSFLFRTNGQVFFCYIISLLSGYPMGAKMVSSLKQRGGLSDAESVRASALCSTSSPMFLIGSVGNIMFRNSLFGALLFITHFLSSIILGIIFSFYKRGEKPTFLKPIIESQRMQNVLYESTYQAVLSILVVGGLITIFYLLTEILIYLNILTPLINLIFNFSKDESLSKSLVFGIFECTRALKELSISNFNLFTLPIASSICGFGGLSVIVQSIAYLKSAKIKIAPFILSKIVGAIVNFILGLIFSFLFL